MASAGWVELRARHPGYALVIYFLAFFFTAAFFLAGAFFALAAMHLTSSRFRVKLAVVERDSHHQKMFVVGLLTE